MNLPYFSFTRALAAGSLILAAGFPATSAAQPADPAKPVSATPQAATGAFDDDPRPVTAAEQIVNSAGLDAARLAQAQRDLLAILQKPDAPADERQARLRLGWRAAGGR